MSTTQEQASGSSGSIEQAQEKVGQGVEQAKRTAGGFIRSQVDERSTQLGEQLQGAVQALRQAGETMEHEGTAGTQLVDRAARQVERTANYLSESDGNRLLGDLERIGRLNPWGLISGGIAVGFVGARFLKASSSKRFEEYRKTYYSELPPSVRQLPAGEATTPYTGSAG